MYRIAYRLRFTAFVGYHMQYETDRVKLEAAMMSMAQKCPDVYFWIEEV